MKKYEIELNEAVAEFFEEVAIIVMCPIEKLLSDALFKQVEIIKRRVAESFSLYDE